MRAFDVPVALLAWLLCGAAALAMLGGNPTAINGVVGAGAVALIFTGLAIWDRG
ncbi:hypothetical protein [Actinoplanes siamensis]|uniref:Uncharacterized protein n=1 Tax=Actinoplanes siamensis TaxID=1223317 RepID=A0A919TNF5_9ACTN|nr:hypothetical protein [Actinoplanes siamensis]GIF08677.1 hypothetical protein Asi03nite_62150 [Actinoplanes siamensis]